MRTRAKDGSTSIGRQSAVSQFSAFWRRSRIRKVCGRRLTSLPMLPSKLCIRAITVLLQRVRYERQQKGLERHGGSRMDIRDMCKMRLSRTGSVCCPSPRSFEWPDRRTLALPSGGEQRGGYTTSVRMSRGWNAGQCSRRERREAGDWTIGATPRGTARMDD